MGLSTCAPFDGNSDFYGLGIRVGVYLQVLSSWIMNSLNADATADTHDANSIFLLAIIIAIASAASIKEIRPVEVWIMLQVCLMFPLTVLCVFGARTNFLSPASINGLLKRFRFLSTLVRIQLPNLSASASRECDLISHEIIVRGDETVEHLKRPQAVAQPDVAVTLYGILPGLNLSFKALSLLKHFTLTWTGAIWRTLILLSLVAANLWFWFTFWDQTSCGYSIFLFDRVHPNRALAKFFQAGAVLFAAAAAVPSLVSICFLFIAVRYTVSLLVSNKCSSLRERYLNAPRCIKQMIHLPFQNSLKHLFTSQLKLTNP